MFVRSLVVAVAAVGFMADVQPAIDFVREDLYGFAVNILNEDRPSSPDRRSVNGEITRSGRTEANTVSVTTPTKTYRFNANGVYLATPVKTYRCDANGVYLATPTKTYRVNANGVYITTPTTSYHSADANRGRQEAQRILDDLREEVRELPDAVAATASHIDGERCHSGSS